MILLRACVKGSVSMPPAKNGLRGRGPLRKGGGRIGDGWRWVVSLSVGSAHPTCCPRVPARRAGTPRVATHRRPIRGGEALLAEQWHTA